MFLKTTNTEIPTMKFKTDNTSCQYGFKIKIVQPSATTLEAHKKKKKTNPRILSTGVITCKDRKFSGRAYLFHLLQGRLRFFGLLEIAPVWVLLLVAPLGVFALFQHRTEVHARRIGHVHLHLGRILAMNVGHYDLVLALVVRLALANAQRNGIRFTVGDELEAATLDDLGDALVELEGGRRSSLHADRQITGLVCVADVQNLQNCRNRYCDQEKVDNCVKQK